ncbi:single-stranded DNA-binding protein [Adhaeribacter swui]|uniref:Single-stranded DNA-binding protein n=1 Tax=Adhaeribacter swui TaxID=2086471 RepID=A0A7G7G832_9BACT|nr:single-stranded DNA-binding protein [Adhaeribacter swui]QNF33316.1 single-stranded DNA-binding protein [Adhaeribacter swui]
MASVNKVILVGNLGKDPEVRHLEGGVAVARFPIATSETFKDKNGEKQERTEWHNIVVWRGLADVAEKYLKKGQSVYIEGKIRTSNYQDKEGIQRYSTEIVADNMTMLGGRSDAGNGNQNQYSGGTSAGNNRTETPAPAFEGEPDDLPF